MKTRFTTIDIIAALEELQQVTYSLTCIALYFFLMEKVLYVQEVLVIFI